MRTAPYWLSPRDCELPSLRGRTTADVAVIGGGIVGLTVAQLLSERDLDIVVVEQETCGSGATARSSGFVTADTELEIGEFTRRFGSADAMLIWNAAAGACEHVRATIKRHDLDCDFMEADCVYAATSRRGRRAVLREHDQRGRLRLESLWYSANALPAILGSDRFEGALRYGGSFAITPHRYALRLRDRLCTAGVRVYERSPVLSTNDRRVSTTDGSVSCSAVVFCADRFLAAIGGVKGSVYRTQTFNVVTAPLPSAQLAALFPDGPLLVWDTDFPNHYFRPTIDHRLLLGGGLLRKTYAAFSDPRQVIEPFGAYIRERLPVIRGATFTHAWSGLIGVTKDLLPLAGGDPARPAHFYAGCGPGIAWNVLAARTVVETLLDGAGELGRFFDPFRAFTDLDVVQPILGKKMTFILSHAYATTALRGSADAVQKRRPIVATAFLVAAGAIILGLVRAFRKRLRARNHMIRDAITRSYS